MSNETIKNYGKSIRSKLLNISKKEDVFHQTILTRFFQERLLYRMSRTRYRDNFYLNSLLASLRLQECAKNCVKKCKRAKNWKIVFADVCLFYVPTVSLRVTFAPLK